MEIPQANTTPALDRTLDLDLQQVYRMTPSWPANFLMYRSSGSLFERH
jgi:hypothetical protein